MVGCSQLAKWAGCRVPARGCHPWPALPLAGAVAPTVGVAAPKQGGCQRARAAAAYIGAAATTMQKGKEGYGHVYLMKYKSEAFEKFREYKNEIWGYPAHVRRYNPDKLESRMERCTFMGYPKETLGCYLYHPEDRKVFVAKRVMFLENEHILGGNSGSKIELSKVGEPSTIPKPESVQDDDPQTYEEAIMSIDFGKWQEAMNSEMDSMYSYKV
ncbi:hypothetical protein OPV22_026612 [Ensete ventricosum]|uniref:Retroviral polymerase SH3-like domain-containing protein n=1 Tax=Ensete ventricosum TaxID=4639 RepID=A0AAV8QG88_ENSVE|nr:hypothetical protein OPV22_026612 [Ensete ventricosum]